MPDTDEHLIGSEKVNNNDIDAHVPKTSSTTILSYPKDALLSLHDSPLVCKPENMPGLDEHIIGSEKINNNDFVAHAPKTSSTTILRYSKDTLLSLHDSPLVCKPENMPPLSSWFGEDAGSPAVSKNMLNGSATSRSADKSIVLGPSKTNFASSLYGGLKRTTESNGAATPGTSKSTSRPRQSEDSGRISNGNHGNNNSNNRMPRGSTYVGEKGFHHYHNNNSNYQHHHNRHEKTGLDRRASNPFKNQSASQTKRYNQSDHQNERQFTNSSTGGGRKDFNRDQRTGNRSSHASHNDSNRNGQDRVPEWMDYNPTDTSMTTDIDDKLESQGDFTNDLEAWKSSMKKNEDLENTPQATLEELLPPTRTSDDDNQDSMRKIMDLGLLDLTSSTTLDAMTVSSTTSTFNTSITTPDLPAKRGSRFAKFFAKREEGSLSPSTTTSPLTPEVHSMNHTQPKSINVNDLFQKHAGLPSTEIESDQALSQNDQSTNAPHGQDVTPNVQMLSEEDLLQSMGARKTVASPDQTNQNAIGFNKVLEILSQPKPVAPGSPSFLKTANSTKNIETKQLDPSNETTTNKTPSPANSPVVNRGSDSNAEVSSPSISHLQPSTPTAKPKKVSQLFGANLPTSVLRQMSVRSEGRSPSLSSNKSGHSGRFSHTAPNSQNGSPLNGHASPSSIHLSPTIQQQTRSSPSQAHRSFPMRATEAQTNTTQLHHHPNFALDGSRPMMNNDMIMMNTAQSTSNRYDNDRMAPPPPHMFQNGEPSMPPPPPPPPLSSLHHQQGGGMNHMMSPLSSFTEQSQQQQGVGDRSFMPPYQHHQHHPPMPPPAMMGMPGQHPMMSSHLSMRLQGAHANGLLPHPPHPPPFMHQPPPPPLMPGMPPPPPMGMGIPQQMYTSKAQGWNSQQ